MKLDWLARCPECDRLFVVHLMLDDDTQAIRLIDGPVECPFHDVNPRPRIELVVALRRAAVHAPVQPWQQNPRGL